MGLGRVCSVHGEWCPEGRCRWCEPLATDGYVPEMLACEPPRHLGWVTSLDQATGTVTIAANTNVTASGWIGGYWIGVDM